MLNCHCFDWRMDYFYIFLYIPFLRKICLGFKKYFEGKQLVCPLCFRSTFWLAFWSKFGTFSACGHNFHFLIQVGHFCVCGNTTSSHFSQSVPNQAVDGSSTSAVFFFFTIWSAVSLPGCDQLTVAENKKERKEEGMLMVSSKRVIQNAGTFIADSTIISSSLWPPDNGGVLINSWAKRTKVHRW